jgi:predicted nuclease of predicted toxin-antitoxin system
MLRLLADENFNNDIVRGVRLRDSKIDFLRAQDVGLKEVEDLEVLAWAADNDRIVVTHDRATMPDFAYQRIVAGLAMPGVFVLNDRLPIREAIDELVSACLRLQRLAGLEWASRASTHLSTSRLRTPHHFANARMGKRSLGRDGEVWLHARRLEPCANSTEKRDARGSLGFAPA